MYSKSSTDKNPQLDLDGSVTACCRYPEAPGHPATAKLVEGAHPQSFQLDPFPELPALSLSFQLVHFGGQRCHEERGGTGNGGMGDDSPVPNGSFKL